MRVALGEIVLDCDHVFCCSPTDSQPFFTYTDIARHKNVTRRQAIVLVIVLLQVSQFRISRTVGRLFPVHSLQPLLHRLVNHIVPDGRFAQTPTIDVDCRVAIDEDVVLNLKVPSAAEKNRPV